MNNQYNKDGKKEGLWVKIYDNGVVQEERNYVNGVREGIYKSYYMNGEVEIIKNYKNGNLHGKYQTFYSDGKLNSDKLNPVIFLGDEHEKIYRYLRKLSDKAGKFYKSQFE